MQIEPKHRFVAIFFKVATFYFAAAFMQFPLHAQSKSPDQTLEIHGVQLTLGMPKDLVFAKLRERKLQVVDEGTDRWLVCGDNLCTPSLGQVSFKNGRLAFLSSRWAETETTTSMADFLFAFYGASADFRKRGLGQCRLVPDETITAEMQSRMVALVCSEHMWLTVAFFRTQTTSFAAVIDQNLSDTLPEKFIQR